jgi:hypothetical protein
MVCSMPTAGVELDRDAAARAFGAGYFNLLRRGADGSLSLSADHWRLDSATPDEFRFTARDDSAPDLVLPLDSVSRFVWDRLPKQSVRSQIRAQLANGDLWTFSGAVDESALP